MFIFRSITSFSKKIFLIALVAFIQTSGLLPAPTDSKVLVSQKSRVSRFISKCKKHPVISTGIAVAGAATVAALGLLGCQRCSRSKSLKDGSSVTSGAAGKVSAIYSDLHPGSREVNERILEYHQGCRLNMGLCNKFPPELLRIIYEFADFRGESWIVAERLCWRPLDPIALPPADIIEVTKDFASGSEGVSRDSTAVVLSTVPDNAGEDSDVESDVLVVGEDEEGYRVRPGSFEEPVRNLLAGSECSLDIEGGREIGGSVRMPKRLDAPGVDPVTLFKIKGLGCFGMTSQQERDCDDRKKQVLESANLRVLRQKLKP